MRRLRLRPQPESTETLPFLYHIKLVTLDVTPRAMDSRRQRLASLFSVILEVRTLRKYRRMAISGGNSFKTRDTLNVGAHRSDKLIDLYTKKMREYHSAEISKVKF